MLLNRRGFTLVELVIVIVIMGIIVTVAVRQMGDSIDDARYQATMDEMDQLAAAVAGNAALHARGARTNFGYVGDVGSLPSSLDALVSNPGYATWNGPYIETGTGGDDYRRDAWNAPYSFNGISISSTGSGSALDRPIAESSAELLQNTVTGYVVDARGLSPSDDELDSLALRLVYPNGSGGYTAATTNPAVDGSFSFGNVPIGNHTLHAIWIPTADTQSLAVSVAPRTALRLEIIFPTALW